VLPPGVYPASVTPFGHDGRVDGPSVARLMAWFEAAGCAGVVLAGTNGEGPSLSAVEKRDLLRVANDWRGGLKLVLGIATPSLTEAEWLCQQAGKNGADAVLVMPPGYFRSVTQDAVALWFEALADGSPVPLVAYNYPKMTGVTLEPETVTRLAAHGRIIGVKDSSGERGNLATYRRAVPEGKSLLVGDETLLIEALQAGWTGSISGAANVVPTWISRIVRSWCSGDHRDAEVAFAAVLPAIQAVRSSPQPAANKAVLAEIGVIADPRPRLPLEPVDGGSLASTIERAVGLARPVRG
jgi:4-hydroxy-tetrahydrodipicolinate synthase